jgi:hypothetical protein
MLSLQKLYKHFKPFYLIMLSVSESSENASVSTFELEKIKLKIESMSKHHHVEILKILKKNTNVKLNENKSGVFVNLSFLSKSIVDEIVSYIGYINDQETTFRHIETQKEDFKNTFFLEKEDKDNVVLYSSLIK